MKKRNAFLILCAAVLFSTMEVASKVVSNSFTPLQIMFWRFLIGGMVLLPFALHEIKKREIRFTKGDLLYFVILAVVGVSLCMPLYQIAVKGLQASTASIIISMNPVFAMLMAHFVVDEKFTSRKLLVILISAVGLILVANPFGNLDGNTPKGLILMTVATFLFGCFGALGKIRISKFGGLVQTSVTFLVASIINVVVLLICGQLLPAGVTLNSGLVMLYLGIGVTGLGYLCYLKAIEYCGPSKASIAFFLKPPLAALVAALFLHEAITWRIVAGAALIVVSSMLNRGEPRK